MEESELVYNQAIRYNVLIKLIQHNFSDRLLTNHDSSLPGIKGKKITAMSVFVDDKEKVKVQDKKFSLNKLDKKEFEEERKLVNSNTLLGNIQRKNKKIGRTIKWMGMHMEVRYSRFFFSTFIKKSFRSHFIMFRKCVKKLDLKVCSMCKKKPHQMTAELVADLPERKKGKGALFWDIQEDPNNVNHYKTLLQTLDEKAEFNPDSFISNRFGRCKFDSCSFTFKSTVESERHYKHGKHDLLL